MLLYNNSKIPVVTRFFCPPEIPLLISLPTNISAQISNPSSWKWKYHKDQNADWNLEQYIYIYTYNNHTYLKNIISDQTRFLSSHCCSFHECIYLWIRFYSGFFLSPRQLGKEIVPCPNSQATPRKIYCLPDSHLSVVNIMLSNICTSPLRNKFRKFMTTVCDFSISLSNKILHQCYLHIKILQNTYICIYTLRSFPSPPASALSKVVFPDPGGPRSSVILTKYKMIRKIGQESAFTKYGM